MHYKVKSQRKMDVIDPFTAFLLLQDNSGRLELESTMRGELSFPLCSRFSRKSGPLYTQCINIIVDNSIDFWQN